VILYRHADPRFPFLWEGADQPPGRWHGEHEGPAHYLADTPNGAWAEFVRHEGITDEADLENVRRALWAVEVPDDIDGMAPDLSGPTLTGGTRTYPACRAEARRLRSAGATALRAPSAALRPGGSAGWIVDAGLRRAPARDGAVLVLFGPRPNLVAWPATVAGRPPAALLAHVRPLSRSGSHSPVADT
jgi:hypothetical protein